jgi:hypothetical protein
MDPQRLKIELEAMRTCLRRDRRELKFLPEGRLVEIKRGDRRYFLCRQKRKDRGITKDKDLVRQLMRKAFLQERVRRYEQQVSAMSPLCKILEPVDTVSIVESIRKERPFLTEEGCLFSEKTRDWAESGYEKNLFHQEHLIHYTGNGIATRSKEEKEIGNLLEQKNIPYRYDWVQYFGGKKYAPDFTIQRESDGKMIFWEHFGMVSNKEYREDAYGKILFYESCGLHLWDNFIITLPGKNGALDTAAIERVCEVFLR